MVDIVEEEIELHLVDTRQLVEEAKKLKEAQRIKKQNDKIQKKLTTSTAPISFIGDPKDILPKRQARIQTRAGAITGQKTANAFTDMQKKVKRLEKKQKEVKKQVNKIQDDIINKIEGAGNLISGGVGVGEVAAIGTRFGPIGILVTSAVLSLIPIIQKQFERGGVFSIFLRETKQTRTLTDIDELNLIRSGTKFLTDDLRIVQGIPARSNTQNLKYEHIRFTAQKLGQ